MQPERTEHYHDMPFSAGFSNVASEPPHYHREVEVTLVLRGNVSYRVQNQDHYACAGQFIAVDSSDLHYIYDSSEDVLMLTSYIDMEKFSDICPYIDVLIFACRNLGNQMLGGQKLYDRIAGLIHYQAELMIMMENRNTGDDMIGKKLDEMIRACVNGLGELSAENCRIRNGRNDAGMINLERSARIIDYLYENHEKNVTLADLSELEHLSTYHISHLIKDVTGLSFHKLLSYIRLEYAVKLLCGRKMTLTEISGNCGFSSPAFFNRCFREWYDMTPSEYRKQEKPEVRAVHGDIDEEEAMRLLKEYAAGGIQEKRKTGASGGSYPVIMHSNPESLKDDIRKLFPLDIMISSEDELRYLSMCSEKIEELRPASITVEGQAASSDTYFDMMYRLHDSGAKLQSAGAAGRKTLTAEAFTAAGAFRNIMSDPGCAVRFSGGNAALFSGRGFPTAYYELYKALSGISGKADVQDGYIAVYSGSVTYLILCSRPGGQESRYEINFGNRRIPEIIPAEMHEEDSLLTGMRKSDERGRMSDLLLGGYVMRAVSGRMVFIRPEKSESGTVTVSIPSGCVAVLSMIDEVPDINIKK